MRDVYQTSIRNFGPSRPRRAPVDDIEARLHVIGAEIRTLCQEIAALPGWARDAKQAELNALVVKQAALQFERDQIITKFFNT